jgi:hypothetical protein
MQHSTNCDIALKFDSGNKVRNSSHNQLPAVVSTVLEFRARMALKRSNPADKMAEALLPTPPGFSDLSKADQVRYLQKLWDQISEDPNSLPVPESHLRLAKERLKRYGEDSSQSHSAFEVLDRLADTLK